MAEQQIVKQKRKLSELMADRYHLDPNKVVSMLMNTALKPGKGQPPATESEVIAFMAIAYEYNLNPIIKEIYGFRARDGSLQPIVGIDGWVKIARRNQDYGGHVTTMALQDKSGNILELKQNIENGTTEMGKMPEGGFDFDTAKPVWTQTSFFNKSLGKWIVGDLQLMREMKRPTDPWNNMPARMACHKSYIQGARKAFGISGILDQDEAERIREVEAEVVDVELTDMKGLPQGEGSGNFGAEPMDSDSLPESPEDQDKEEDHSEPRESNGTFDPGDDMPNTPDRESSGVEATQEQSSGDDDEPAGQADLFSDDKPETMSKESGSMTASQRGQIYAAAQKLTKARRRNDPAAPQVGKPELNFILKHDLGHEEATMSTLSEYQAKQVLDYLDMAVDHETEKEKGAK